MLTVENMSHEGALALRNAIVEQAAHDYVKYYRSDVPNSGFIIALERWFLSPRFDVLGTGCTGEWFINELRKLSISGEKSGNKRIIQKGAKSAQKCVDTKHEC